MSSTDALISLLTLKIVISKLADMAIKKNNVTHVPYRDSKLYVALRSEVIHHYSAG